MDFEEEALLQLQGIREQVRIKWMLFCIVTTMIRTRNASFSVCTLYAYIRNENSTRRVLRYAYVCVCVHMIDVHSSVK